MTPVCTTDRALRVQHQRGAILRSDAGAADAVEGGGRVSHLDEAREAEAAIDALFAQALLLGAQAGIVHQAVQMGERLVMRQLLEFQPDCGCARIGVVGKQVAPAQLERVHADLGGGELDQPFGHRHRDRVADGAVLAHHIFVLEHHARQRAVVRAGVGPAHQVDDLVGLDAGSARIDRIGADAGQVVDLEGGDGAVALDADLGLDAVVAGVDVGDEALDAVGDEFHRPLEQLRQRHRRHLVGVSVYLDAETAADVLGDDAHLGFGEIEMLGEQVLHHVRRLRAVIDG